MKSNGLPRTAVSIPKLAKHEKNVLWTEGRESFKSALLMAQNDPQVQAWLYRNMDLYRK